MACSEKVHVVPFAILMSLKNGRLKRKACLHQIFLDTGEKCYRKFSTLKAAFETKKKKHKFVGSFSKFKSSVTSGKMMNTKDSPK